MADANNDANNEREAAASSTGSTPRAAAGGASGPVPKRGRRGGRAPSKPAAAHGSAQHRIYRVPGEGGKWVLAASATVKGARVDSQVHRYGREFGFKKVNPYQDERQIEATRKRLEVMEKTSNAAAAEAAAAAGVAYEEDVPLTW